MKKINLGLLGASGKMGRSLRACLKHQARFATVHPFLALSSKHCDDFDFSVSSLKTVEEDILDQVDVWIDFSNTQNLSQYSWLKNKPVVSGVTGYSESEFSKIKTISKNQPILWSSNFSVGLWVVRQALKNLAVLTDFDFSIDEIHHTLKKDNPSGTALTLQKDLEGVLGKKIDRPVGKRLGGVFGIHQITAAHQSEMIKIEHTALNREVFAEGALQAALWLVNQKNGLYSMDQLMQSKYNLKK